MKYNICETVNKIAEPEHRIALIQGKNPFPNIYNLGA